VITQTRIHYGGPEAAKYVSPDGSFQIISGSDGDCAFTCLAHMAYRVPGSSHDQLYQYQDARASYLAHAIVGQNGDRGITHDVILAVAGKLRIGVSTLEGLEHALNLTAPEHYRKKNLGKYPLFPRLILTMREGDDGGHVSLA